MLVFPDMRSGEEWLTGVSERGDNWYSSCAAVILPANWSVPQSECMAWPRAVNFISFHLHPVFRNKGNNSHEKRFHQNTKARQA